MPIYEYECRECGHRMDALQKISEPALVRCPTCSKDSLTKLVSAPQFRLKGAGWYETDFKKDKRRNIAGGEGDKSGATEKADDGGKKAKEASASGDSGASKSDSSASSPADKKSASKKSDQ